jgi:hypothetical protein
MRGLHDHGWKGHTVRAANRRPLTTPDPVTLHEVHSRVWRPLACESCGAKYRPDWETDWSLSGERIHRCPKCNSWNWPPIAEADERGGGRVKVP